MDSNYFEWFGMNPSLSIDEGQLKRSFYQKSKSVHPDFHTLADSDAQEAVLQQASYNNVAYKTLKDFDPRLKYVLDLYGYLPEEGKASVPQEFLMEMMDFNESIMELEMDYDAGEAQKVLDKLKELDQSLKLNIKDILALDDLSKLNTAQWEILRDYYLKKRYLWRLEENIDKMK